jgi:HlyD family secretion protein
MRKALIAFGAALVLAVIVWASLREAGQRGTEVETHAAELRKLSSRVKGTGEITPDKRVEISAKVVGEIIRLPVEEGQAVRAGQLLVEIERDLYESARDQARAALRQAEVAVRRQQVELIDAERNLERILELHADGLVSQEQQDRAQLAVDTARVEVDASVHAVSQYRSALQRAEDDLARTNIRSPMDGIVIQLDAEQGETVVPGSTNLPGSVIMTVADMATLLAEVEVSEVDVVDVKLGQPAEVTVDALGSNPQLGHVAEIATSGRRDPAQRIIRFAVKVALDDPDPDLRPAMTAKVDILTATREQALTVPIQAVVKRTVDASGNEVTGAATSGLPELDTVYLVDYGKAIGRRVTTGISDEIHVEIVDGLEVGQRVIVGPYRTLKSLKHGDSVRATESRTPREEPEDEQASEGSIGIGS